jgi:drug/metabolite transporter (DMT)-like permease
MGIIFGLLNALIQATGYTILKKSYQDLAPSVAFLFDACFGILIWIPFALIVGFNFSHLPLVMFFALISALLSEAFVFYVLSKGEISITGTIFSSYPIYTILFSLFINNEKLLPWHWFFVGVTILGTVIVSLPEKINKQELKKKAIILWGVAGAIAVGLSDSLSKNVIDRTSAEVFLVGLALAQLPVALIYLKLEKQKLSQFKNTIRNFNKYKYAIFGSLLTVLALIFFWLAFQDTFASIASPLTATYPGIMIILAYFFLKERIKLKDLIGLLVIISGVIGISYFYL